MDVIVTIRARAEITNAVAYRAERNVSLLGSFSIMSPGDSKSSASFHSSVVAGTIYSQACERS